MVKMRDSLKLLTKILLNCVKILGIHQMWGRYASFQLKGNCPFMKQGKNSFSCLPKQINNKVSEVCLPLIVPLPMPCEYEFANGSGFSAETGCSRGVSK